MSPGHGLELPGAVQTCLWYDPADPSNATADGPGSWLLGALAAVGLLVWLFTGGAELISAAS